MVRAPEPSSRNLRSPLATHEQLDKEGGRHYKRCNMRAQIKLQEELSPVCPPTPTHPHTHTMGSVLDWVFLSLPSGIWGPAPFLVHSVAAPWLLGLCQRFRGCFWIWLWRLQHSLRPRKEACKSRRTTCRHYTVNTAPSEFQAGFHASLIQGGMKLT